MPHARPSWLTPFTPLTRPLQPPITPRCHLRKGEDLATELQGILLPHEIAGVLKATHRPNYVMQVRRHSPFNALL